MAVSWQELMACGHGDKDMIRKNLNSDEQFMNMKSAQSSENSMAAGVQLAERWSFFAD